MGLTIVYQDVPDQQSSAEGDFQQNEWLIKAMTTCRDKGTTRPMGLLSPAVSTATAIICALLDMAAGFTGRKSMSTRFDGRMSSASSHEYG